MKGMLMQQEIIESQPNVKINVEKLPFGKYILRIAQNESIPFIKN
jgi:hypothetical protein